MRLLTGRSVHHALRWDLVSEKRERRQPQALVRMTVPHSYIQLLISVSAADGGDQHVFACMAHRAVHCAQ